MGAGGRGRRREVAPRKCSTRYSLSDENTNLSRHSGIGVSLGDRAFVYYPADVGTAQYRAWCHNNGHHETPKRPREDWNAKILWKMRMELSYQWDLVEDEALVVFESLRERVTSELKSLRDRVLGEYCGPSRTSWSKEKPTHSSQNHHRPIFSATWVKGFAAGPKPSTTS